MVLVRKVYESCISEASQEVMSINETVMTDAFIAPFQLPTVHLAEVVAFFYTREEFLSIDAPKFKIIHLLRCSQQPPVFRCTGSPSKTFRCLKKITLFSTVCPAEKSY